MCNFRVGQRVVCVDDGWAFWQIADMRKAGIHSPTKGHVYTVRAVETIEGEQHLRLSELVNPVINYRDVGDSEQGWSFEIFRPVVERNTDISVFTRLLNTTPETVGAA